MAMSNQNPSADLASRLLEVIHTFIESPLNCLGMESAERAWGEPLVGFARGDDPIFDEFRCHIGAFYWTPAQAFAQEYPDAEVAPQDLTVVSWVLPQTKLTKHDSRCETILPPERWVKSKYYGEYVNNQLRDVVVATLIEWGIPAMSPMRSAHWRTETSEQYGYASTWSERHTAYAAGLGTFGLCDGLITPVGKAMRCGSAIVNAVLSPTPRPYSDHHAYCLHYAGKKCESCIKRCPAGAVSASGHDKKKCRAYLDQVLDSHIEPTLGLLRTDRPFSIDACGFCQTKVPCESGIPAGLDLAPST
jgi:epoxyqueuosine reductase